MIPELPADAETRPSVTPRPLSSPPGAGLLESVAWLIGLHVIQAAAALVALFGLALVYLGTHPIALAAGAGGEAKFDAAAYFRGMSAWFEGELATVFGIAGVAVVTYGIAAVSLRMHRQGGLRGLGWQLPSTGHIGLIGLSMPPLSLLCTELQKSMHGILPQGDHDLMQVLFEHLAGASFPLILWAIAIAPAFGEELICRGLIGRGLVARWGAVRGVLITSILFGVMHIEPAQAVAVIPLGMAIHFVYLMTRSFWAPVLLHLLNNAFAAVLLKYGQEWEFAKLLSKLMDDGQAAPWNLMSVSAAMVTALGLLLWQTRVQYARGDGTLVPWTGSLADGNSAFGPTLPVRQRPRPLLVACSAFNSLGFAAVLWQLAAAR